MNKYINPNIEKWKTYVNEMSNAMKENDISKAEKYKSLAESAYKDYKEYTDKIQSCKGFSSCNAAITESLPRLLKENTKAVKEIMKTMLEDKNLKAQALFYSTINNCSSEDTASFINEALNLVDSKIDLKTINESNKKLVNLVKKYGIVPNKKFSDEQMHLFENCDYLMSHKKKLSNLGEYTNHMNSINEYVKNHKVKIVENKKIDLQDLIESYNNKYVSLLNLDEQKFVNDIINATLEKKQSIFEEMRTECLNGIEKMLNEDNTETDKSQLLEIKNLLKNKVFSESNFIEECVKMIQIREIIFE